MKNNFLSGGSGIWVGAGICKSISDVKKVLKNQDIEGIVFGSITVDEKMGNPGTTFSDQGAFSINSIGLSNHGASKYSEELHEIVNLCHAFGKKIIISIAAEEPDNYVQLALLAQHSGADGIEINFGCPNKWGPEGKQKQIASFNTDLMGQILRGIVWELDREDQHDFIIGVKVSPYSNPVDIQNSATLFDQFEKIVYVATSNTFPNAYYEEDETSSITTHTGNPNGYGGLAGAALFPIALGQVVQFRAALPERISVVGVGGIETGKHMEMMIRKGAAAIQIVSAYYRNHNASVFSEVYADYMSILS